MISLGIDHESGIWLGTESNGLVQLIPTMIETISSSDGLIGQTATVMTQDQNGAIYTGTTNGLSI